MIPNAALRRALERNAAKHEVPARPEPIPADEYEPEETGPECWVCCGSGVIDANPEGRFAIAFDYRPCAACDGKGHI